jgi:membrane protein
MPKRPALVSLGWTVRDYAKRVWDNSAENAVLFLAGGIAFNILLAAIPFVLLLVTGLTYILPVVLGHPIDTREAVATLLDRLLPPGEAHLAGPINRVLEDILRTRASVGIASAVVFLWFSTRLFGSLRTVLGDVFDIQTERGIIEGKIFDTKITLIATLLFVASTAVTTYIGLATTRGLQVLLTLGIRSDVMSRLEIWIARGVAFTFIALMFFALYRYLPSRRIRAQTAWVAALFASVLFEIARIVFTWAVQQASPQTIYTGTLLALIILVVWCYYGALIFILGGEVGQVYDLRRMRRLQREVFT